MTITIFNLRFLGKIAILKELSLLNKMAPLRPVQTRSPLLVAKGKTDS